MKIRLLLMGGILIVLGLGIFIVKGVEAALILPVAGIVLLIAGACGTSLINGSLCNGSVYDINQNQWVNTSIPIKNNSSLPVNSSGSMPINISNDKYLVFQNGGKYSDISLNFISV